MRKFNCSALLTALFSLSTLVICAQGNKRSTYSDRSFLISIGGEVGLPLSNSTIFSYLLSGGGQMEYRPDKTWGITANLTYSSYVKKDTKVNGVINYAGTIAFINALGGINYTLPNDIFIHLQSGLSDGLSGNGSHFCYQAGLGYIFSRNFDAEIKYSAIRSAIIANETLSCFSVRIGYNF